METTKQILPAFKKNNIAVCFSSDNNYAPYLCVAIQSLIYNTNNKYNYDICILTEDISEINKDKIKTLLKDNISIRFINVSEILSKFDKSTYNLASHYGIAIYYRLFIPQIFKNYEKIIYLDSDMIINHDISELYFEDMKNYSIAAALEVQIVYTDLNNDNYLSDTLKMKNPNTYFQSGLLVFDIKKLIKFNFTQKCFDRIKEIGPLRYPDQDTLNSVFDGNIHFLDFSWNVCRGFIYREIYKKSLSPNLYKEYMDKARNWKILHYCSGGTYKPWINPSGAQTVHFWEYARMTPFYEEIIYKNIIDANKQIINDTNNQYTNNQLIGDIYNYKKYKRKYRRYKILSKITFGKMRNKYKQKRKDLKARLTILKEIIKPI